MGKQRAGYEYIDYRSESKKLNRVIGQVEGVQKMLDDQRKLEDILMQCKAVHSALKSIESRIVKAYLEAALEEVVKLEKKKNRAQKVAELEELYKHAA